MYVHPAFKTDRAAALSFAAARGFGLVVACTADGPVASPLPFRLDYTADGTPHASFHVAKANPLAALASQSGRWLLAVTGDDAYVSPIWYASPDQVPTWLYQAVHLSGRVQVMDAAALRRHLADLSEQFETPSSGGETWSPAALTPGRHETLTNAIVGIGISIDAVQASFKLNQHKSDADHVAVVDALARQPEPGAQAIAKRMLALRPHLQYASAPDHAVAK